MGRVSVEKNLPLLTRIWRRAHAKLVSQGVEAQLVIVGDGPYKANMASTLEGADVHFLGFRHGDELSTLYASSDLFAFTSVTDTLGQVVMEAQSSGLPVLVTDVGGPKEVVEEGDTGLVLPSEDTDAWVDALARLAADDRERERMSVRAAESMKQYDILHSFRALLGGARAGVAGRRRC